MDDTTTPRIESAPRERDVRAVDFKSWLSRSRRAARHGSAEPDGLGARQLV